jgi:hypothetical protein
MPVLCAVWRHQHQHSTPNQAPTWPAMHSRATATPTATASFTHPPAVHERSRNSMKRRQMRASQGWRSHLPVRGKQHPNGSRCAAAPAPPAAAAAAPPPSRAGACPVRGAPGPGPTPAAHSAATCWRPRQVAAAVSCASWRSCPLSASSPLQAPGAHWLADTGWPTVAGWPSMPGVEFCRHLCQVSRSAATYARCRRYGGRRCTWQIQGRGRA